MSSPRRRREQSPGSSAELRRGLPQISRRSARPRRRRCRILHIRAPTVDRWGIQLGAFHAPAAAAKAARVAENLPIAKGKPVQIVEPGKATKTRLYRARLLNFSPREAQSACASAPQEEPRVHGRFPDDSQSRRSVAKTGRSKPAKSRVNPPQESGNATPLSAS